MKKVTKYIFLARKMTSGNSVIVVLTGVRRIMRIARNETVSEKKSEKNSFSRGGFKREMKVLSVRIH